MYYCFKRLTDENIFLLTFALTSIYFSGVLWVLYVLLGVCKQAAFDVRWLIAWSA